MVVQHLGDRAGGARVPDHPQCYSVLEATLELLKSCFKTNLMSAYQSTQDAKNPWRYICRNHLGRTNSPLWALAASVTCHSQDFLLWDSVYNMSTTMPAPDAQSKFYFFVQMATTKTLRVRNLQTTAIYCLQCTGLESPRSRKSLVGICTVLMMASHARKVKVIPSYPSYKSWSHSLIITS